MKNLKLDNIDKFYEIDLYIPTRTLFIGSVEGQDAEEVGTDFRMAERVIKGLHVLDSQNDSPIRIIMNNIGGDEYHGMAIYDAIRRCRSHVTMEVAGHAMSMGSVILQAADRRLMTENSRFMMHYGTPILSHPDLHVKQQDSWQEEDKKFRKWMEDLYLDKIREAKPRFKRERLQHWLDFDKILWPREAVEFGLVDEVLMPVEGHKPKD